MKKIKYTLLILLLNQMLFAQIDVQKYLWEYPLQRNLIPDEELTASLQQEMQKIIDAGDLFFRPLPCLYSDQIFDHYSLYQEPGRVLNTIALAWPYLEEQQQLALRTMVTQLFGNSVHAPWAPSPLGQGTGQNRELYEPAAIWGLNSDFGLWRPSIQNVYSLWLYFYRTADTTAIQPFYNTIRSFYNNKVGMGVDPGNMYGTMSAHVGMARLAQAFNDNAQLNQATNNLLNYLTLGLDMHYADSMAFYGLQGWNAPYAQAYESRNDGWIYRGYIFLNLSAEIGRYIQDHLYAEIAARHTQGMNRFPLWWLRQSPYFTRWTGDEGVGLPSETFGMFMPMERWVMNRDPETLTGYMLSSPTGIADCYWLEALVYAIESNALDEWVDVRNTAFSTDIVELPAELILESMILTSDSDTCLAATQTIIAGGDGNIFHIQEGASVVLVAGRNILMREGVTVESGSVFSAYIAEDGNYCVIESTLIAASESFDPETPGSVNRNDESLFRIYPNPGTGLFTLELRNEPTTLSLEIYNAMGKRLQQMQLSGRSIYEINLQNQLTGIYLLRVMMDGEVGVVKVVKQ